MPTRITDLAEPTDDDELPSPAESATRTFGYSIDFRPDLAQVVIAMAVTRDGIPVRFWTFASSQAESPHDLIRRIHIRPLPSDSTTTSAPLAATAKFAPDTAIFARSNFFR